MIHYLFAVASLLYLSFCPEIDANTAVVDALCSISAGNNCDLSSFSTGKLVQVFPGGKTACMDSAGPYSFVVRKGASDKVLFYFQGGGSCLNTIRFVLLSR